MSPHEALRAVFASVNLGEPQAFAGWKLFPMFPTAPRVCVMLTAHAAVERGLARIEELPDAPSVRALRLYNGADLPVLVRDGDLFVSGRQDRIADRALLVAARSEAELPVSCVEQNRWAVRDRLDFTVCEASADVPLRHRRMATVRAAEAPDQQATWDAVAERRRARGFADERGSLIESQRAEAPLLDGAVSAFAPVYGAAGLALCHDTPRGARVAVAEWFADPEACAHAWTGIVRGALTSLPSRAHAPRISRSELRAHFAALASAPHATSSDDRHGVVVGFIHGRTRGRALVHGGRALHLATVRA